jgi:glutamyl/glutaminyl-tRNA synthetase
VGLQRLLGLPTPRYRHHLLLLEERGRKLAKLHGAVGAPVLRRRYSAPELCGLLAGWSGIASSSAPCTPASLVAGFSWARVRSADLVVRWTGTELIAVEEQ